MKRLTFRRAKRLCGLGDSFEIKSEEDYQFALRVWKDCTVEARKVSDDALAADLSQCKQLFKQRYSTRIGRKCPKCGGVKSPFATHCQVCSVTSRFYRNRLHTQSVMLKENEIEEGLVIIPPRHRATGLLASLGRKLATTGQIGDSFVTHKPTTTVKCMARLVGMEVIVRIANVDERDLKKRRWRCWRSDGLSMEEVNERIQARMAGKPVPPSEPCKPPLASEVSPKLKKKVR